MLKQYNRCKYNPPFSHIYISSPSNIVYLLFSRLTVNVSKLKFKYYAGGTSSFGGNSSARSSDTQHAVLTNLTGSVLRFTLATLPTADFVVSSFVSSSCLVVQQQQQQQTSTTTTTNKVLANRLRSPYHPQYIYELPNEGSIELGIFYQPVSPTTTTNSPAILEEATREFFEGQLLVHYPSCSLSQTIPLQAEIFFPSITVSPSSTIDFGQVPIGSYQTLVISLSNKSNRDLQWELCHIPVSPSRSRRPPSASAAALESNNIIVRSSSSSLSNLKVFI